MLVIVKARALTPPWLVSFSRPHKEKLHRVHLTSTLLPRRRKTLDHPAMCATFEAVVCQLTLNAAALLSKH